MSTKHTPGEWKYEGGDNASVDIILDNNSTITISRYNRFVDGFAMERDEMEANARLIAAAPEMLAMLQELEEACEDMGMHDTQQRILALINKATQP